MSWYKLGARSAGVGLTIYLVVRLAAAGNLGPASFSQVVVLTFECNIRFCSRSWLDRCNHPNCFACTAIGIVE